jgi:hypothetical protein
VQILVNLGRSDMLDFMRSLLEDPKSPVGRDLIYMHLHSEYLEHNSKDEIAKNPRCSAVADFLIACTTVEPGYGLLMALDQYIIPASEEYGNSYEREHFLEENYAQLKQEVQTKGLPDVMTYPAEFVTDADGRKIPTLYEQTRIDATGGVQTVYEGERTIPPPEVALRNYFRDELKKIRTLPMEKRTHIEIKTLAQVSKEYADKVKITKSTGPPPRRKLQNILVHPIGQ